MLTFLAIYGGEFFAGGGSSSYFNSNPHMKRLLSQLSAVTIRLLIPTTAISALLLLTATAHANPQLQITELSDSELTVTLDGVAAGTVTQVAPDQWEWRSNVWGNAESFSGTGGWYNTTLGVFWSEPSDATKANFVGFQSFDFNPYLSPSWNLGLIIYSDVADFRNTSIFGTPNPSVSDGELGMSAFTEYSDYLGPIGFGPVDVYFSDLRDNAKVPDGSSTLALLGFSI